MRQTLLCKSPASSSSWKPYWVIRANTCAHTHTHTLMSLSAVPPEPHSERSLPGCIDLSVFFSHPTYFCHTSTFSSLLLASLSNRHLLPRSFCPRSSSVMFPSVCLFFSSLCDQISGKIWSFLFFRYFFFKLQKPVYTYKLRLLCLYMLLPWKHVNVKLKWRPFVTREISTFRLILMQTPDWGVIHTTIHNNPSSLCDQADDEALRGPTRTLREAACQLNKQQFIGRGLNSLPFLKLSAQPLIGAEGY